MVISKRKQDSKRPILLVGGDPLEQATDAQVLRRAGYVVKTVRSGLHAQQILAGERFSVVITEQSMQAGIDGIGLLVWVKEKWPETRRVVLTAHPRGALVVEAKMRADARTLIRPAKPDKLLTVVKEELDAYGE